MQQLRNVMPPPTPARAWPKTILTVSMKRSRIAYGAFTLIELATVAIVLSVIAAIAVPRFGNLIANQRLEAAGRRIQADLALAQRDARLSGTSRTVSFNATGDRYKLWGIADLNDPNKPYVVLLNQEPYGVDLVSASFGGDLDIVFDAYGLPDSGGSIVVQVGELQKTINVEGGLGRAETLPSVDLDAD